MSGALTASVVVLAAGLSIVPAARAQVSLSTSFSYRADSVSGGCVTSFAGLRPVCFVQSIDPDNGATLGYGVTASNPRANADPGYTRPVELIIVAPGQDAPPLEPVPPILVVDGEALPEWPGEARIESGRFVVIDERMGRNLTPYIEAMRNGESAEVTLTTTSGETLTLEFALEPLHAAMDALEESYR